jgi:hypothetical protein
VKPVCPKCHGEFPADQVNAGTDVAYCPHCAEAFKLTDLIERGETDEGDLGPPPSGAWFKAGVDEWEVGATTRSAAALFLVPFMCVWSGFSLGGIYGSQIVKGHFELGPSLFGIPFFLGTLLFGSIAVMTVCGKVRLRVRGDDAEAFAGVGAVGWRRRFQWSQIAKITDGRSNVRYSGQQTAGLCLEGGGRVISFGTGVTEERRTFLMAVLRRMLVH